VLRDFVNYADCTLRPAPVTTAAIQENAGLKRKLLGAAASAVKV
jgi:hypothetical protein